MKTLNAAGNALAINQNQCEVLEDGMAQSFDDKLKTFGEFPLRAEKVKVLQVNVGKLCNQTCVHCHVDAGPDRKEVMSKTTMQNCLEAVDRAGITVVDITGGAPEMNPDFRWFVGELHSRQVHIMVRCNLTIILANPVFGDLPSFYKDHEVEVISSLPHFSRLRTDAQRGTGVFDKSIDALKRLNEVGYGKNSSGLILNLVYNPSGAFLPPEQSSLERDFKKRLKDKYDIVFNQLFAITNIPISRFLDYLLVSGNYEDYMQSLMESFNPMAIQGLMCKEMISVGWDGQLYDCDFNQMLGISIRESGDVKTLDPSILNGRLIRTGNHCYGCTAGAGSSCGGQTAQ